jgi:hypothetical protein
MFEVLLPWLAAPLQHPAYSRSCSQAKVLSQHRMSKCRTRDTQAMLSEV